MLAPFFARWGYLYLRLPSGSQRLPEEVLKITRAYASGCAESEFNDSERKAVGSVVPYSSGWLTPSAAEVARRRSGRSLTVPLAPWIRRSQGKEGLEIGGLATPP